MNGSRTPWPPDRGPTPAGGLNYGVTSLTPVQVVLLLAGASLLGIVGAWILWRRPRMAVTCYLVILIMVPVWVGVQVAVFWVSAHFLMTLLTMAVLWSTPGPPLRWHVVDYAVLCTFIFAGLAYVFGLTSLNAVYIFVSEWLPSYCVGRLAVHRIDMRFVATAFVGLMGVAAVSGLLELLTGVNPWTRYLSLPNGSYGIWGRPQLRAGMIRSEAAFGHAIALGGALAIAAGLTWATKFSFRVRLALTTGLIFATGVTASRIGMITAVVGVALTALLATREIARRDRYRTMLFLGVIGVTGFELASRFFASAGPEADTSAQHRINLLSLIPEIELIGRAEVFHRNTAGQSSWGSLRSIDSTVLDFALSYGWLPTAIVLLCFGGAICTALLGRASVALTTLLGQLPALVSVALITQYSNILVLLIGLTVGCQQELNRLGAVGEGGPQGPQSVDSPPRGMNGKGRMQLRSRKIDSVRWG